MPTDISISVPNAGEQSEEQLQKLYDDCIGSLDQIPEAQRDEARQVARMIYVRVRDEHGIESCRIERRFLPVALAQFPQSLEHPAIDEHAPLVRFNQILRARYSSDAAPE